ncbi:SDR family NAD(P)-dependent oxidoreductase [Bacillus megaterium]|uniref:oxidoreductase n=1 Tax=Priestia megaterium TaxID=1404 RepID=UPI001293D2DA|nr:oxidoreductase [Priestia megaterium]MQR88061.1 SDR family NAD(P)-dependent oxidoreductase [Priestia megaterium]
MSQRQKVWFITGCSTGFGRELAEQVINQGYKVAVTARNTEKLQELKKKNADNVLLLNLDVTDKSQIQNAVEQTIHTFGEIDVLVNNAGIGYFSSVEESVEDETRKMFDINFWGLMNMTNAVLPYMRKQQSGHILNLSSIGGIASFPALGYYHATKYAVEGISESLAQEVAPFNIRVSLIEPSSFRTDWAGRSSVKTETTIYKETVEPTISTMAQFSGNEPGNPKKAAEAMISIVESENPPLRLLLGETAYQVANHKYQTLLEDIVKWKDTTLNVDFK